MLTGMNNFEANINGEHRTLRYTKISGSGSDEYIGKGWYMCCFNPKFTTFFYITD